MEQREYSLVGKLIDPPDGWMYGFPKRYEPMENELLDEWLIRNGYPKSEVDFALNYLRVIE